MNGAAPSISINADAETVADSAPFPAAGPQEIQTKTSVQEDFLKRNVYPDLDEAVKLLVGTIEHEMENELPVLDDSLAWLAYVLKTGQKPERRKRIHYKAAQPLADHLTMASLCDALRLSHFAQLPPCRRLCIYGTFRSRMPGIDDDRIVFYGIRHIVDTYLKKQWTVDDVENAALFFSTYRQHAEEELGAPYPKPTDVSHAYPFPKQLFQQFVEQNNGYIPVKLECLAEGSVVYRHTPVYQITATEEYAPLATFVDSLVSQLWYATTVATLSRYTKDIIEDAYKLSVDESAYHTIESKLHDFGFRGCTSVEQSVIGGAAHLLNFSGSDTMSAAYHVQFHLNHGRPVVTSIPATEHSVMTAWNGEKEAILNMIDKYGSGAFAVVMDSYDYENALDTILPEVVDALREKNGTMLLRPDSGDPVEAVMKALHAAEKVFGSTVNTKGYKVLQNSGVIQGDGIDIHTVKKILDRALSENYSAQCVGFGMGSGLLQRVDKDDLGFTSHINFIEYLSGKTKDVCQLPTERNSMQFTIPGYMKVVLDEQKIPTTLSCDAYADPDADNLLKIVYNNGPLEAESSYSGTGGLNTVRSNLTAGEATAPLSGRSASSSSSTTPAGNGSALLVEDFSTVKGRVTEMWERTPPRGDGISERLMQKLERTVHPDL